MPLAQSTINGTSYYTDGVKYYTFHRINSRDDPFFIFACRDLGINKTSGFTPDEEKRINDLAGMGPYQKTKYLLLKNGQAIQMPYRISVPDVNPGDIILREVAAPRQAPAPAGKVWHKGCASWSDPGINCSVCGKPLTP